MSEERLRSELAAEGLADEVPVPITGWANGRDERYAAHRHGYDKVLLVESGSISFELPDLGRTVELAAGDRLDLPRETLHSATVGPSGVACLEAHLAPGSLRAETATRRPA